MQPDDQNPEAKDDDNEALMDHMALEAMHAIEAKDPGAFRDAHHVLVADILNKLSNEMESKEE